MKFVSSISGLPISAASAAYAPTNGADVSAVASAYAESAASGKLDSTASSQFITSTDGLATTEYVDSSVSSKLDTTAFSTVSSNFLTSETVTATAGDGTYITSINGMGLSGQGGGGGGGAAFPAEINYGGNVRAVVTTGFQDNTATRPTLFISSNPSYNSYPRMMLSENHVGTGKSGAFLADAFEFYTGTNTKVFRADPTGVSATKFFLGTANVSGQNWTLKSGSVTGGNSTSNWFLSRSRVSGIAGTATWQYGTDEYNQLTSVHDTVSANSASWGGGGGGGVDSATVSAIASAYGHSALSSIYAGPGIFYGGADDPIIGVNYDGAGPLGTNDDNALICKTDGTTIGVNAAGELVSLVGGGVDSATVSAIASSYAESAVSSKQDSSAMSAYALSSDVSGVIDTVSANSATWGGATGDYVEKSATEVTIGLNNTASSESLAQGQNNSASSCSLTQGSSNTASSFGLAQGYLNIAGSYSLAQGSGNSAWTYALAQGVRCSATGYSLAQGLGNKAKGDSFAQGYINSANGTSVAQGYSNYAYNYSVAVGASNTASGTSFAWGLYNSAKSTAVVFGQYNLKGNGASTGDNVAFVIGDGTATLYRHDLMRVTKDGEITMYSSTADTAGTGIMSSIRAISAAATGGGGGVVTATGSASATAGTLWFPTTSYLVSSINGSALLPYGYSALSGNSANWTLATSAVSANSANWNSAYSLISGVTALMDAI